MFRRAIRGEMLFIDFRVGGIWDVEINKLSVLDIMKQNKKRSFTKFMVSETSLKQERSIKKCSGKYLTEEIKTDCPDKVCGLVGKKNRTKLQLIFPLRACRRTCCGHQKCKTGLSGKHVSVMLGSPLMSTQSWILKAFSKVSKDDFKWM